MANVGEDFRRYITLVNSGAENDAKLCCMYSVNLQDYGLPEVLAVDIEADSCSEAAEVLNYAATCMLNSNRPMPHLNRRFLKRPQNLASYVAFLQITDPVQLDTIYQEIMGKESRPEKCDMVVLAMPIVPRGDGMTWGQVPAAPENKTKFRNVVWRLLEMQKKSEGFVRILDQSGKENTATSNGQNMVRIKIQDAFANPDWRVIWNEEMKPKHLRYLEKHIVHFASLAIDEIETELAGDYVGALCQNADRMAELYQQGSPIARK